MVKKNSIIYFEFIIESLIFFLMYSFSGISHISFGRYYFIYVLLFLIIRNKETGVLIWVEIKNLIIFYSALFSITLVIQPMKNIDIKMFLANFVICFTTMFLTLVFKRYFHKLCWEKICDNVMVVGIGGNAKQIIDTCENNHFSLLNPVVALDCAEIGVTQDKQVDKLPIITINELESYLETHIIHTAIFSTPSITNEEIRKLLDRFDGRIKNVKYLPQVTDQYTYNSMIEDYDGLLLVTNNESIGISTYLFIKRTIDIVLGIVGVVILFPLAFVIKVISKKNGDYESIFFTQDRIGLNGKKIKIYKFRSMVPNAEAILEELMENDAAIREEYLTNKKLENDPRITKIGNILRKTSLDEWPQFINVLKGEMSIVGPRPYLFREKMDMGKYYNSVIKCKPGITGMWQVSGRSDTTFERRCILDEYYSKNINFWLDFIILVKTIKTVIGRTGAK